MITRPALVATAAAATLLLGACAGTPAALRPEAARAATVPSGYLDAPALETLAAALPGPPTPGSALDQADKDRSTRMAALEDTDRWLLCLFSPLRRLLNRTLSRVAMVRWATRTWKAMRPRPAPCPAAWAST